jgi:hypothetical protein
MQSPEEGMEACAISAEAARPVRTDTTTCLEVVFQSCDDRSLIFYDLIGKGGGIAAKAFDHGKAISNHLDSPREHCRSHFIYDQHTRLCDWRMKLLNIVNVRWDVQIVIGRMHFVSLGDH